MAFSSGAVLTSAQLNDFAPGTRIQVPDGSEGAPSKTNTGDLDTGVYFPSTNAVGIATAGTESLRVRADGVVVVTGKTATLAEIRVQHADAAGDSALYFGDATDVVQAGLYYDESAQSLYIKGYDDQTAVTIDGVQAAFEDGSESAPSITNVGDLNTGVYFPSADAIALVVGGSEALRLAATLQARFDPGSESLPGISFIGATNYGMRQTGTVLRLITAGADRLEIDGTSVSAVDDNSLSLGNSVQRWVDVWAVDTSINSSDLRRKSVDDAALGLDFVRRLRPFSGRWLPEHRADSDPGRLHQWLGAQHVAEALTEVGIDPADTALWRCEDDIESLAYGELIPVLVQAVQELADVIIPT